MSLGFPYIHTHGSEVFLGVGASNHPPSCSPTASNIAVLMTHLTAPPAVTRPPALRYPQPNSILSASRFCTVTAQDTPLRTQSTPRPCVERKPDVKATPELFRGDCERLEESDASSYFHTTIRMGNRDMHEETKRAVETALGVGFFGGAGKGAELGLLG